MVTTGQLINADTTYSVILDYNKDISKIYISLAGEVISAYKTSLNEKGERVEYCYSNTDAKDLYNKIKDGLKGCTAKNCNAIPFILGTASRHEFTRKKIQYTIDKYNNLIVGLRVIDTINNTTLELEYTDEIIDITSLDKDLNYIELKRIQSDNFINIGDNEINIGVKSLEEISLSKDISWLLNKRYYIVNDDEVAERLFTALDNYNGEIAYDTETTGLKINMFGKINSKWAKKLYKYNLINENSNIKADRLVGIIFCVEENVSYYFPCFNRKFKNLYEDKDSLVRKRLIQNIKSKYTIGEFRNLDTDMARYWRDTPEEKVSCDCLMMERCRNILTTKHLVAHNGSFEWKVSHLYDIDINLKDDTMIMHQIMYKFRSTTSNAGEPSNLKYLTKREFGIDQIGLNDFFANYKEDESGTVRGSKKGGVEIDFSYMDYDGARAYAPADGDTTLALYHKYKKDLIENHKELIYIYNVEVIVACAIGYMEFYGHRIDEKKIEDVRNKTVRKMIKLEHQIRQLSKFSTPLEDKEVDELNKIDKRIEELEGLYEEIQKETEEALYERGINYIEGFELDNILSNTVEIIDDIRNSLTDDTINKLVELGVDIKETSLVNLVADKLKQANNLAKDLVSKCKDIFNSTEETVNLASPAQVADLLFNRLQYPFDGEKISVAKKVLKGLMKAKDEEGNDKYPVAHLYSEWKKLDTLVTKFFDALPGFMYPGGFIFSNFGQISTATGRMSSKKPNSQQYSKDITKIVVPRDNNIILDADYSQIEYRTLVALANEPKLAELFKDPDNDYHTLMASLMYGVPYASVTPKMRSDAKSFNFGIPYGMGFKSLAILLTGMSGPAQVEEAKEKYQLYFKDQPNVKKFFEDVKEKALVNRYTKTYWNRYRYYSFEDKDGNFSQAKKAMALRQAANALIQGCLDPKTKIQTKEYGIVEIQDVVNEHLHVWDGEKWSEGDILYSGKKRKCVVTFTTGQQFICSPTHKFLVRSAKGNDRFVECQHLKGRDKSTSPHRVVINKDYKPSDSNYSSDDARLKYTSKVGNAKNVFLDDIGDSFKIGVVLGRLASDGNTNRDRGVIRQIIAEHEFNIIPKLEEYMKPLGITWYNVGLRENRTQEIKVLKVNSKSLASEVSDLNITREVHKDIFKDTELLRGFLRGLFDGDGGVSGHVISLNFGKQANFETMFRDIQKALLFFGIRARYYEYPDRYRINIQAADNQKFLDLIGFINEHKQEAGRELEAVRDEHIFGKVLNVESVEITDEYIDMYDVCNTDGGYYVADGMITHNTAADIFKISVARNFLWIRNNGLIGKVLIINMIHDEQLMEIDCDTLNTQAVLRDMLKYIWKFFVGMLVCLLVIFTLLAYL